jgi:hypothetical protein
MPARTQLVECKRAGIYPSVCKILWLEHTLPHSMGRRQALEFQDALLDHLSSQLDQQEALLVSEAEGIRLTGKRSSPRRSTR